MVEDNKGNVETSGLELCSVENFTEGRRKRRAESVVEQVGDVGSAAAGCCRGRSLADTSEEGEINSGGLRHEQYKGFWPDVDYR